MWTWAALCVKPAADAADAKKKKVLYQTTIQKLLSGCNLSWTAWAIMKRLLDGGSSFDGGGGGLSDPGWLIDFHRQRMYCGAAE